MNRNLEYDVVRSTEKLCNQAKQLIEIQQKSEKLLQQVNLLEEALKKETQRVMKLGEKQPRRDGKPETSESQLRKDQYNAELFQTKLNLVRQICTEKKVWDKIEAYLPTVYKDENLPQY